MCLNSDLIQDVFFALILKDFGTVANCNFRRFYTINQLEFLLAQLFFKYSTVY